MTVAPDWALAVPTPGIHNAPAQIGGPPGPPIPLQQLGATMQFFIDVFVGKIAIAFGGIEILGWHPFQFLADWGQARIDQANANYILASTADGKAQDALDFIASMVDGILGTGHTVGDFVDWLQDTSTNAATSISQWNSVISGLAVGDFSGLVAFFEGIPTDIAAAAADGAAALDKLVNVSVAGIYDAAAGFGNLATSLLKNLTPTGGNIGQFDASGLAGALGGTLTFGGTALSSFFGNINSSGGLLASGLTGAFNGAVTLGGNSFTTLLQYLNSSGQFAAGQLTGAINGGLTLGGVTLSTLVTNINSSGQILAAGITGALGTGLTVGGVTLSTLFTNINSSGQILGTGITGAINGAATIGGTALSTLATNWNAAVTDVNSLISGVGGSVIGDVTNYLQNVPNTAVQGLTGFGTNIGNTVQALSDGVWQGLRAFLGIPSGVGPPQVSSAAQQVRVDLNSASDIAASAAAFQAKQSISKQSYLSIDPSADSVFPLANINGASPSTVGVTAAKSVMGIIGLPDNGLKKSVVWLGGSLTGITGVYVNIYKVNTTTGEFTRTHQSSNIIGSLTSPPVGYSYGWQFYNLPMTDFFPTLQGEWYVAEIQVTGTGTYNIVGVSNAWMPTHTSVYPKALGATRGPAAPTFKSAATGLNLTSQAGGTKSWTHNIESDADFIAIVINGQGTTAASISNVKVGGVAATLGPSINFVTGNPNSSKLAIYYLQAPGSGSKTVQLDISGGSVNIIANSFTYSGVSTVGASGTTSGNSFGTLSHSVPTAANQTVLHAFGTIGTLTAYNAANVRWNTANVTKVGDFPGTGSNVSVSATNSGSYGQWGSAYLQLNGVVPSPPSSIATPTYDAAVPWIALAGGAGRAQYVPETVEFETAGTFTYNVPSWVIDGDYIDIVPIGAGAGGSHAGSRFTTENNAYKAGGAGSWNPVRLRYGDAYDIPTGTTTFTVNVGAGGAAAVFPGIDQPPVHGSDGGNTTVAVPGYPTITANGGVKDGTTITSTRAWSGGPYTRGDTPGNVVFQGVTYFGGAFSDDVGNSPGGGGRAGTYWSANGEIDARGGAPGAVYVTAVQNS